MRTMIPYGRQNISQDDIDAVVEVQKSDFITQGPCITKFENSFKEYTGAKHAFAVNSATSALHIACLALGLGKGDRLWTSPNSFVASSNCGLYCGADVDFVDIDPRALDNCLTNLKLNFEKSELNGLRLISRDRFELSDKYKLVFANILEHVLISEKELLLDSLDSKGYLILSGILNHQVDNIKSQYESLIYLDHISKGDWSAIIFKKG